MYTDGVVTLAPFERDDLPQILAWVNDVALCQAIDRVLPVTSLEHEKWYEELVLQKDAVTFGIRLDASLIGLCGLRGIHPRQRHAELWIYLGDATQREKGLGSRAVRLLVRFGFDQLNLHRIHLYVVAHNTAAQRVYRACGFHEEGRDREHIYSDGRYHDAVRMGILHDELT